MGKILITFPSNFCAMFVAGIYDLEKDVFKWINLPQVDDIKGASGVLCEENKCFILVQLKQDFKYGLFIIFQDGSHRYVKLNKIIDAHSIIRYNNSLLVNNTASNNLVKIKFDEEYNSFTEEVEYSYGSLCTDGVHLNSLIEWNKHVYISMFGEKNADFWAKATNGKIIDITDNREVISNLMHPHSLKVIDNKLCFLESKTGKLHIVGENNERNAMEIGGYLRGLDSSDDMICVGKNALRRKSKSQGTINDFSNVKLKDLYSEIVILKKKDLADEYEIYKRINITTLGSEVYDITTINSNCKIEFPIIEEDANIIKNMWVENQLLDLQSFIEFGLPKGELKLLSFGPKEVNVNEGFNIQPTGESAIWVTGENITYTTKIVINNILLESSPSKGMVTAIVPKELYSEQGSYYLYLIETKTNTKSNEMILIVK